ncbi:unnamed protein product [Brassica oleracea var. botrytis]
MATFERFVGGSTLTFCSMSTTTTIQNVLFEFTQLSLILFRGGFLNGWRLLKLRGSFLPQD